MRHAMPARGCRATSSMSETVVDLTSVTEEEERQLAIEQRIRTLELALRDAEMRAQSAELELDAHLRPARAFTPSVPVEPT